MFLEIRTKMSKETNKKMQKIKKEKKNIKEKTKIY